MSYTAPIADIRFALEACAGLWKVRETGAFPDLDEGLLEAILDGVGALSGDVLAPLNASIIARYFGRRIGRVATHIDTIAGEANACGLSAKVLLDLLMQVLLKLLLIQ